MIKGYKDFYYDVKEMNKAGEDGEYEKTEMGKLGLQR